MTLSIIGVPLNAKAANDLSLTIREDAIATKDSINININNKIKGSKYTWTTSNKKLATVNNRGVVKGIKPGNVTVTCIIKTPDGKTHKLISEIAINSNIKVTVVNQKKLNKALANEDVRQIILKSSKEIEFKIPKGNFAEKRLYMKAPLAEIINEGEFKSVHTYVSSQEQLENALNNEKITIITIVTSEEEKFEIKGEYPAIRVILNAPNSKVLINSILRKVDITEIKEIEEVEYTVTPIPEDESQSNSSAGNYPSTPSNPSVPSEPTQPKVPDEPKADLATIKANYVSLLNTKARECRLSIADDKKAEYDADVQEWIKRINDSETEFLAKTLYQVAIFDIENYDREPNAEGNSDYQAYLDGNMTISELYEKHSVSTDGYEYSIPNILNGIITLYLKEMKMVVVVDTLNNKTHLHEDNTNGDFTDRLDYAERKRAITLSDNSTVDTYFDRTIDGMIFSYNFSANKIVVKDITKSGYFYIDRNPHYYTKWQDEQGKWYYGANTNLSTLDWITPDNHIADVRTSTVSGSAIDFKLYMNNVEGINRISDKGTGETIASSYYDVVDNRDNTWNLIFNNEFIQKFIVAIESDKAIDLEIFPTESRSYGTVLKFEITVDTP